MRVIVANVNGVRASLRRGGLGWLARSGADVITMQEVRADADQLAKALADGGLGDWHVRHAPADVPGRSGVAVLSKAEPVATRIGWGPRDEFAASGRWIEVDISLADTAAKDASVEASSGGVAHAGPGTAVVTVVSAYVHTGEADTPRQDEKYRFLDGMTRRMAELASSGHALVTGDLNVAHREVDIKNWRGNRDKAGFLLPERAYLDGWLADGWVDLGREFGGEGPGPYTWWSWRGKAFDNDAGWRIDYAWATASLASRALGVTVGRAPDYASRWSDHAPVIVDFG